MDYESFKFQFSSLLSDGMTVEDILHCLDQVLPGYEVTKKEQPSSEPDVLTMFIDAKDVEEKSK